MPELPDHLDLTVALAGQPLAGAWVELRLPMERKQDYVLMVGPTDGTGALTLSRADLEDQVSVIQLSGFMDYSSLGVWRGELVLRPFDAEAVARARQRLATWPADLLKVYPADVDAQLTSLAERLADQPGSSLQVTASARGGAARLTCLSVD